MHDIPMIIRFCSGLRGALPTAFSFLKSKQLSYFLPTMNSDRLVWVDLEMTGLDIDNDHIIEMACVITDGHLNIIAEGPDIVINQPDQVMQGMDQWCIDHHGKSGLTQAVKESTISLSEAEDVMLKFVRSHTPQGKCPIAGNSIHVDRMFLDKYMKKFVAHLHYRIVDVSTIKELCKRWYPNLKPKFKKGSHRALQDIHESIQELGHYQKEVFKTPSSSS